MRLNEATPLSSQATASPSMMQERERRRANVSTPAAGAYATALLRRCDTKWGTVSVLSQRAFVAAAQAVALGGVERDELCRFRRKRSPSIVVVYGCVRPIR